ncbi:hypothetical protein ABPG75_004234 [Micractinium tetrahymenae]
MTVPLPPEEASSVAASGSGPSKAAVSGSAYQQEHSRSIRPVLDTLARVQPLVENEAGISAPAIVVIGDQSTGKTSILEAISGVALPRGQGIVTRCPLRLDLRHGEQLRIWIKYKRPGCDAQDESSWERAEVAAEDVGQAVQRATAALAGCDRGIVDEMIYLEVTSPHCPDLSLIDLPGITRVPVGEQPEDIEEQIKALIRKHIAGESKVLLCVTPADLDFSTAEAFVLAKEVDPEGRRTLGVVSKIDKAEPGIRGKLEGTGKGNMHLDLGFVAVRCRTPEELSQGVTEAEVREKEAAFFEAHPELKQVDRSCLGLQALVQRLAQIQVRCIAAAMPKLREQVQAKVRAIEGELAGMPVIMESEAQAMQKFHSLLGEGQRDFQDLAGRGLVKGVEDSKLMVAARLLDLCEGFAKQVHFDVRVERFMGDTFLVELHRMQRNVRGTALKNFLSHPVFEQAYIKEVWSKLGSPAAELVRDMRSYVEEALSSLLAAKFKHFPNMSSQVAGELADFLEGQERLALEHVGQLVEQQEHVMSLGRQYDECMGRVEAALVKLRAVALRGNDLEQAVQAAAQATGELFKAAYERLVQIEDLEQSNLIKMQMSLVAYARVVLSRFCDDAALCVRNLLVSKVGKQLAEKVAAGVAEAAGDAGILRFMHDPAMAARKERLRRSLDNLRAAMRELKSVPMAA